MQLIPLLLVTDHDSGGYNMDDSEIGVVLMSVAGFQFLWQVHVHTLLHIHVHCVLDRNA